MRPDSTHKTHKKRREKRKSRRPSEGGRTKKDDAERKYKTLKHQEEESSESSSSHESDLDLEKELLPIGSYIANREEMLEQMFRSIGARKLRAMLPEILKTLAMDGLKRLCLDQLEVMSRKRILKLIEGVDPENISSSSSEDEAEPGTANLAPLVSAQEAAEQECPAPDSTSHALDVIEDSTEAPGSGGSPDGPDEEPDDVQAQPSHPPRPVVRRIKGPQLPSRSKEDLEEGELTDDDESEYYEEEEDEKAADEATTFATTTDGALAVEAASEKQPAKLSFDQMEILELELRARAIKAMLTSKSEVSKSSGTTSNALVKVTDESTTEPQTVQAIPTKTESGTMPIQAMRKLPSGSVIIPGGSETRELNITQEVSCAAGGKLGQEDETPAKRVCISNKSVTDCKPSNRTVLQSRESLKNQSIIVKSTDESFPHKTAQITNEIMDTDDNKTKPVRNFRRREASGEPDDDEEVRSSSTRMVLLKKECAPSRRIVVMGANEGESTITSRRVIVKPDSTDSHKSDNESTNDDKLEAMSD